MFIAIVISISMVVSSKPKPMRAGSQLQTASDVQRKKIKGHANGEFRE
jgi:hypothetical protein